jgi:aspartate racemase
MKRLGIVGGLGPAATAYFYELITGLTKAGTDQDHLEILIFSRPSIPDRTAFIMGESDQSPAPMLADTVERLIRAGAERIAVPCVTAHHFYRKYAKGISVPVLDMIAETADWCALRGVKRAGIVGTLGAMRGGDMRRALLGRGVEPIEPPEEDQKLIMRAITSIKAGAMPPLELLSPVFASLIGMGAERIILGCTELSLLKRDYALGAEFTDPLRILAKASILSCGGELTGEYDAD